MGYLWAMRAVFADCHVGQRPGDEEAFLEALELACRRGARAISLLGDVFHYFVARPNFETPVIRRFLDRAQELASRDIRVTYVEGNRDFFLRGSYAERYFDRIVDEETFQAGPHRFLLTHGDRLNERDYPYRFWRFLSKNAVSRAAAGLVPRGVANRFVSRVEARLHRSNFKHKTRLPVEMIRSFAERRLVEGIDVILLGHFHKSWVEQIGPCRVEILPAFAEERRWMEVGDHGETSLASL
ncbi:MAG TPA: metallophosphoesterase [Thermoanaerobaculia bacterium]|nr:metallophosphoesterase [Thermoanaerobaculia bacterium]